MSKYDFSDVKGELRSGGYQPGPVLLKISRWSFEESKNGKPYLLMTWENDGFKRNDGKPFTSSRLYFSSPKAVQIARGKLHEICDILNIDYDADLMSDDDKIIALGEKLFGRSMSAELVETGEMSDKGFSFLGVRLLGHDGQKVDLFIKNKNEDKNEIGYSRKQEVAGTLSGDSLEEADDDIPF